MGDNLDLKGLHRANKLSMMADPDLQILQPALEIVELEACVTIVDAGETIEYLYLPHSAVICLMTVMRERGLAEAATVGVHRPTITIIARALQAAGLIRYSHGAMTIVDRDGLERSACECYGVVKRAYEEIFS